MSIISEIPGLIGTTILKNWFATYTGSQGYSQLLDPNPNYTPTEKLVAVNPVTLLTPGFNVYFKMQGFNPATGLYEVWHCMNTPQILPPSGDPLINIQVVTTWIDR